MEKQYVVFQLHTEEYGIDITHVQEIVLMDIQNTPSLAIIGRCYPAMQDYSGGRFKRRLMV